MPNAVGPTGITIQTPAEIRDEILNGTADYPGMLQIYPGANTAANTPDGQQVEIWVQGKTDCLELIQQVATSMDPDQAVGVLLDERCAINGVLRRAGTPTVVAVDVTVTQALNLPGLDSTTTSPFTVADSVGNSYQLVATHVFSGAGTDTLNFQSTVLGPLTPEANTITVISTITLGVSAVNNPGGATTVGTTEESDFSLRIRRQQSVSKPGTGYVASVSGALYNVDGVTDVRVLENDTGSVDSNGLDGHSIWVIVDGTATDIDIANAIYAKRHAGTGQNGGTSIGVLQVDGTYFTIRFDRPTSQPLWISFSLSPIGSTTVDANYVRSQLLADLSYRIGQPADTTTIVALIRAISSTVSVSAEGVSDDGATYVSLLDTAAVNNKFTLSAAHIIINGAPG